MDKQIAFSFDAETKRKIFVGAMIALAGGAVAGYLALMWRLEIERVTIIAFLTWLTPVVVNGVREFISGDGEFDFTKFRIKLP